LNFSPRMQSRVRGFVVVGELRWRVWDGVVADVWEVNCAENAGGDYVSPDPRLFVMLDRNPGGSFILSQDATEVARHETAGTMSFIPGELPIRGEARGLTNIRHLDLHFAEAAVTRRFGKALDLARLARPRFQLQDDRMTGLARAIAEECANPLALHDLYGAGLVDALLALLFDVRRDAERRRPGLSRRQLALVTDFIEANCFGTIRLGELAELAQLSETYFSHAFKASTGQPPHRWQMQARIRGVQSMLLAHDANLSDIATTSGFADQAHFTRVFKSIVGLTPAEWRRGASRPRK
jgi:AraC family transcriptional regulator